MPIDPSIPLRAISQQQPDPMRQVANVLQIQQMQRRNALEDQSMAKRQQIEQALSTARTPDGGFDMAKARDILAQFGDTEGAMKIDQHLQAQADRSGKPPTSRTVKRNGQEVTEEWDKQNKAWVPVGESPIWNPAQAKNDATRLSFEARRTAAAEMAASTGQTAATDKAKKGQFDQEQKMRDDHRTESQMFVSVRDSYQRVKSALKNATTSAAATLAGATSFMKLLDPGSVVRESELGMALAASGAIDRILNYGKTLQNGKVLTKSQAADFNKIADTLYSAAEQSQKQLDAQYGKEADTYGLNKENVVRSYYAPSTPTWKWNPDTQKLEQIQQ
jgi:hypothetical protein